MPAGKDSDRRRLLLVVLLGAAAFGVLLVLGDVPGLADPGTWSRNRDPELAMLSALRLLGLAVSAWLVASSVLYRLAVRSRRPLLRRLVGSFTLPAIRVLVERGAVVSLTAASFLGGATGAWARADPPPTGGEVVVEEPVVRDAATAPTGSSPSTSSATRSTATSGTTEDGPSPAPEREPPAAAALPRAKPETGVHIVEPGESFWLIAVRLVAERLTVSSPALSAADVHATWVELVEANRATIRSGNPNLIYPGEALAIPRVRS